MDKKLVTLIFFLSILVATSAFGKEEGIYFPTPVPVNLTPGNYDGSDMGFGYNIINLTSDWEDDFFTWDSEDVGEIEYHVQHVVLAYSKSRRQSSSIEYDLLVGEIKSKSASDKYHSKIINRDVNVDHSGDGMDIGVRLIFSKNIYRQVKDGRKKFIDWNYALSLHAAYYYIEGTYRARSFDNMFANEYNSKEEGIFLRPVISFQPIIELAERISLIPYAGIGTRISFWSEYWEDTGAYIFNGYNLPDEKTSGEESGTVFSGIETFLGFDVGIKIGAANNYQLTIGGVLTTLFGKNDSDFSEIHVVCSIPLN